MCESTTIRPRQNDKKRKYPPESGYFPGLD
jgi:hypothetical protein